MSDGELASQGEPIAACLHTIQVETAKKDAQILTLEAKIAAQMDEENRGQKAQVEQFKKEAEAHQKRVEDLEKQLADARAELEIVKREMEAGRAELRDTMKELTLTTRKMEQGRSKLGYLQAEIGKDGNDGDDKELEMRNSGDASNNLDESNVVENGSSGSCGDDDSDGVSRDGGQETSSDISHSDREQDQDDDQDGEEDSSDDDEWIPSQQAKRSHTRSLAQQFNTPPSRKKQKILCDAEEFVISPTIKKNAVSDSSVVGLITALERSKPWDAIYAKSPTFSHTFEYEKLVGEAKMCILALQIFKSKFRRELWEQHHWINLRRRDGFVADAAADRAARHLVAKARWKKLQELLIAMIITGVLPQVTWTEPFLWIFRVEALPIPPACITMENISALDANEPMRCFYVDCIDQHPFYSSGKPYPKHALPEIIDGSESDSLDESEPGDAVSDEF